MKLTMLLFAVATGYLSWLVADGFLFAMSIVCVVLAFTVKHWDGKNG